MKHTLANRYQRARWLPILIIIALNSVVTTNSAFGSWFTEEYGDPFDDQKRILAGTVNNNDEALVLKCDEFLGDVYLAFFLDEYIDKDEVKAARVRFDKSDIIEVTGYADDKVFFVTNKTPMNKLLFGLSSSNSVAIEVYSYDYDRIVTSFDLEGYSVAEKEVRTTCNFPK